MTSLNLPSAVVGHFAQLLETVDRGRVKQAQIDMSAAYRIGGHSRNAVPDPTAALAYAIARMPATYAACVRAFDLAAERLQAFAPSTMLDVGAGPGTAVLAAAAVWPGLRWARMVEPNADLAALAGTVLAATAPVGLTVETLPLDAAAAPLDAADLTTLSYVLAEQTLDAVAGFIARVADAKKGLIIVVEPGTPAGYARVMAARQALIAHGWGIVAPCPHDGPCPLAADSDWCHSSVRLQRSAGHRQLKDAELPYEDEPLCFVAAVHGVAGTPSAARLIRPAAVEKGFVDLALCTTSGLHTRRLMRRTGTAYKAAKKLAWGDAVE